MNKNQEIVSSETEVLEEVTIKSKRIHILKKKYNMHVLLFLSAFFIATYFVGFFYYHNQSLPNTTINNHDVSHLTLKETTT